MLQTLNFFSDGRDYSIPFEKICAIARKADKMEIYISGDLMPLIIEDDFMGNLAGAAKKQLNNYLNDKQNHWMEAIQYGIIMSAERGKL